MLHDDLALVLPVLNSKPLDLNVARALSGNLGINHVDGRFVVGMQSGGPSPGEAKFLEDGTQALDLLGSSDRCKEFSFSGAGGCDGLGFATVGNSTTGHHEGIPSSGTTLLQIVPMSSINKTAQVQWISQSREGW